MAYKHARCVIDGVWCVIDGIGCVIDGIWCVIDGLSTGYTPNVRFPAVSITYGAIPSIFFRLSHTRGAIINIVVAILVLWQLVRHRVPVSHHQQRASFSHPLGEGVFRQIVGLN